MSKKNTEIEHAGSEGIDRREVLGMVAAGAAVALSSFLAPGQAPAASVAGKSGQLFSPGGFVYTEVQISVPFDQAPWKALNVEILKQPGFLNKTWLSGAANNSVGGLYAFDTVQNAEKFVTGYFPAEARKLGATFTTRVFDAQIVLDASMQLDSAHFGRKLLQEPGAFVYTEVQMNVPFGNYRWRERNQILRKQKGLLGKTWLSGVHTNTVGGFYAFDNLENAKKYAIVDFPAVASKAGFAAYSRIFDAAPVRQASRDMHSPFFS